MERKLGHVTLATNRTKILHSLYGFKMVTSSNMLTCSARFLRLSVVKGGCWGITPLFQYFKRYAFCPQIVWSHRAVGSFQYIIDI